nr:hypothetical protein Iba_chr11dCG12800 [Ipomoea batatas]
MVTRRARSSRRYITANSFTTMPCISICLEKGSAPDEYGSDVALRYGDSGEDASDCTLEEVPTTEDNLLILFSNASDTMTSCCSSSDFPETSNGLPT